MNPGLIERPPIFRNLDGFEARCARCALRIDPDDEDPVMCQMCTLVRYCSPSCEDEDRELHQHECGLLIDWGRHHHADATNRISDGHSYEFLPRPPPPDVFDLAPAPQYLSQGRVVFLLRDYLNRDIMDEYLQEDAERARDRIVNRDDFMQWLDAREANEYFFEPPVGMRTD